jgi:hypothetical protein
MLHGAELFQAVKQLHPICRFLNPALATARPVAGSAESAREVWRPSPASEIFGESHGKRTRGAALLGIPGTKEDRFHNPRKSLKF